MVDRRLLGERGRSAVELTPCLDLVVRRFLPSIVVTLLVLGLALPALGQTQGGSGVLTPSLRASDLLALKQRCGSTDPVRDSLQLNRQCAFDGPEFKAGEIVAFEENGLFMYAVGDASKAKAVIQGDSPGAETARLVRRFIFLKPSTFVVDDLVRTPPEAGSVRWLLRSQGEPSITGGRVRVAESSAELLSETLMPEGATISTAIGEAGPGERKGSLTWVVPQGNAPEVRFLHVLHARGLGEESSAARSELARKDGRLELTVFAPDRTFRLSLPPAPLGAGQIAVSKADGEVLLEGRLFPSGVLPYGPEGTRLLERWDAAYLPGRRPGWDTGRPSSELKKAVEGGTLRPCRAVVLGCGSGTNAVYVAGQGFDVTGIDIAPRALTRAEEKARKADVRVRWLLADVLALPELEPFELVYDRGCYHGVRRQNAAGYVEAVRRLSRPGTRLLILAGNANEPEPQRGPPRVKEEEIRSDFSAWFEFEWLRETRFDTFNPDGKGALAWSILLRKKGGP